MPPKAMEHSLIRVAVRIEHTDRSTVDHAANLAFVTTSHLETLKRISAARAEEEPLSLVTRESRGCRGPRTRTRGSPANGSQTRLARTTRRRRPSEG